MTAQATAPFPLPLESYHERAHAGLGEILVGRIHADPVNLAATVIFALAIIHTFLAGKIRHWSHEVEARYQLTRKQDGRPVELGEDGHPVERSFPAQVLHFFGEIEAIFGIWAVVLAGVIVAYKGLDTAINYLGHSVNYTEAIFVVVVMAMAATRPILSLVEGLMQRVAALGRGAPGAWWLATLIIAPLLGSFITEPAAMTIAALLLAKKFYALKPSPRLMYATLGLLFVNISVGGTFTHFAAPPILMVAGPWHWGLAHMAAHFGWKAAVGIVGATLLYYGVFRREFAAMKPAQVDREEKPRTACRSG